MAYGKKLRGAARITDFWQIEKTINRYSPIGGVSRNSSSSSVAISPTFKRCIVTAPLSMRLRRGLRSDAI